MVVTAIISIIVGFAVGVLSGLLGIGGGTILVPVFSVFFGLPAVMATGTSLFTIVFTSISGAISRVRGKSCNVPVGIAIGIGGAITSPIGVYAAIVSPELAVVIAVAAVITYSIVSTLRKALRTPEVGSTAGATAGAANGVKAGAGAGGVAGKVAGEEAAWEPFSFSLGIRGVVIGLVAGVLSGYVGLGGGFIMIPLMRNLLGYSMKQASGTSLLGILFIALSGSITQIAFGNVNFLVGIAIIVGSIPGAILGGMWVKHFKDRTLSFLFVGFLTVATVLFVLKQFGLLG